MQIRQMTLQQIKDCKFKPEPHTVAFKEDGEWYAAIVDDKPVSVVCIVNRHGGKYFSDTYTLPEYRRKGICTKLIWWCANVKYKNEFMSAHCLKASVNCYKRCGFVHFKTKFFKHGTQYYMKREVQNGKTEQED